MKKNKLLLVSPIPPPYGGIARWTEQLLGYLSQKAIIDYKHLDIAVRWRSVHGGVLLRIFGGVFQLLHNWLKLIVNLISGFNIVHLTSSGSFGLIRDLVFSFTAKVFCAKFITHIRFGRITEIFKSKNYEYYLLCLIFKFSDKIICIDKKTYKFLSDYSCAIKSKIYLIPNCIDYSFESELINYSEKKNIISFVGWVKKEKGVDELVGAFLNLGVADWKLNIIGPIDQKFLNNLEGKYSLSDRKNIQFMGNLDNSAVFLELAKSKIFVLPSYTEGFPNVVLEAMVTKNSIVATKVGAIPEMLENKAGILVDVADQKDLEKVLSFLLRDYSLQCSLGENAFQQCKKVYSIETVVNQYLSVWNSLESK